MFKSIAVLIFLSFFIFAATSEEKELMNEDSDQDNETNYISETIDSDSNGDDPSASTLYVGGEEEGSENESEDVPEDE